MFKWIKSDCKDSILINAVIFNYLFTKESKEKVSQVCKRFKQHNSSNIDNKSAY